MSRAALRYAKAIMEVATSANKLEVVSQDMQSINTVISENIALVDFLQNPIIDSSKKLETINEIFLSLDKNTKNLFSLLASNKRFDLLQEITISFSKLYDEYKGVEIAHVTTAQAITKDLEEKVIQKLKEFSNKTITIENIIDPSIIGGFIIRLGDKQYNASIANKLQTLKREFSN